MTGWGDHPISPQFIYNGRIPRAGPTGATQERAPMSTCMCGNPIDTIGTMCSRCGALQTLGLEMKASAAEIESTYTTLVKVWHPDRFQTDPKMKSAAEEKLKEINAAHDYLMCNASS